jgi:hypothetical protein
MVMLLYLHVLASVISSNYCKHTRRYTAQSDGAGSPPWPAPLSHRILISVRSTTLIDLLHAT